MTAPVSIEFDIVGPGWADIHFEFAGGSFVAASVSNTTDALGDLLRAAIAIATGGSRASVSFDREPAEWRLNLTSLLEVRTGKGPIIVRILEFADCSESKPDLEGSEVFVGECAALDFAQTVLDMAGSARERFEEFGLGNFTYPVAAFNALESALNSYESR